MYIRIKYIRDTGDISKERLVLETISSCEIGNYVTAITNKASDGKSILSKIKYAFWFPDKKLPSKALIVLYTKKGNDSLKKNEDGTTSYFYYRNEDSPVFGVPNSCAVVFETEKWICSSIRK